MANVTRKRNGELLQGVLRVLIEHPEGLAAKLVLGRLENLVPPNAYETEFYVSGSMRTRRYDQLARFATVDAVKAGWMVKAKGVWSITEEGRAALKKHPDPAEFFGEASRLYRQWSKAQDAGGTEEGDGGDGTKEATRTFEEAEEQAWDEVRQFIEAINPYDFQAMVAGLLKAMGYHVSWVSPPGKDGGVDVVAWADPLGTRAPRIKVQVKRRQDAVRVEGLRAFMALLGEDDVGLFVSTGGFTKDADDLARAQEKRKITLIDLDRFFDLWVEYYGRLEEPVRQKFPIRPIWFLAPAD